MLEIRDTSQTPLHRLVGRHLQSFQAQIDAGDATLPRHVVRSLERFAVCGDAATGFTWLRCDGCGAHRIIAFRCGTRGLCPGCGGRRMASLSHQWIDRVFPEVGVRQWVLSVPWPIRFCLASEMASRDCTQILRARGVQTLTEMRKPQPSTSSHPVGGAAVEQL